MRILGRLVLACMLARLGVRRVRRPAFRRPPPADPDLLADLSAGLAPIKLSILELKV